MNVEELINKNKLLEEENKELKYVNRFLRNVGTIDKLNLSKLTNPSSINN